MPSLITLTGYDPVGAAPITLHLSGAGTAYTGSGTPWTSQSTSPYQLSMNSVTGGIWTPTAPSPALVLSGTPPFAEGAELVYRGYANVEEEIGIQMYATSFNNAADLLSLLRRLLSPGLTSRPPRLSVTFNGASNAILFDVVSGTVREDARFVNEEAGLSTRIIRATLQIVRRPLGSSGETLLNNATSMNNSGTSAPTNLAAFGAMNGDTIWEGAPINLKIVPSTALSRLYLASALSRQYTTGLAATYTTSSTSGALSSFAQVTGPGAWIGYHGANVRILMHASVASNAQFRVEAYLGPTSNQAFYVSPWISSTASVAQLIDCGGFSMSFARITRDIASFAPNLAIRYRSTNGASASTVVTSTQVLVYYDFCVVNPSYANGVTATAVILDSYDYLSLFTSAPRTPRVYSYDTGASDVKDILDVRGTPPRYYAGCSLFAAYLTGSTGLYTVGNTMTATVYGLKQYHTLRGGAL